MSFDPIGKWDHNIAAPKPYGKLASYLLAAGFLDGCRTVEDWGCGSAYARRFFTQSKYVGVDGSGSQWCDVVDDLRTRKSFPDGLLLRHVLEHNPEWATVLANTLLQFRERLVLVIYNNFVQETCLKVDPVDGIPVIWFKREDLWQYLESFVVQEVTTVRTNETVFLVRRP